MVPSEHREAKVQGGRAWRGFIVPLYWSKGVHLSVLDRDDGIWGHETCAELCYPFEYW